MTSSHHWQLAEIKDPDAVKLADKRVMINAFQRLSAAVCVNMHISPRLQKCLPAWFQGKCYTIHLKDIPEFNDMNVPSKDAIVLAVDATAGDKDRCALWRIIELIFILFWVAPRCEQP